MWRSLLSDIPTTKEHGTRARITVTPERRRREGAQVRSVDGCRGGAELNADAQGLPGRERGHRARAVARQGRASVARPPAPGHRAREACGDPDAGEHLVRPLLRDA